MPEEQDNQIEPRNAGGISRRSETARRGSDAARFVRGLSLRHDPEKSIEQSVAFRYVRSFGSYGRGDGQFASESPISLANTATEIYVGDTANHRIQVFDKQGNFLRKWGQPGNQPGQFRDLADVRVGPDGRIYVLDADDGYEDADDSEDFIDFVEIDDGDGPLEFYEADRGGGRIRPDPFLLQIFNQDTTVNSVIPARGYTFGVSLNHELYFPMSWGIQILDAEGGSDRQIPLPRVSSLEFDFDGFLNVLSKSGERESEPDWQLKVLTTDGELIRQWPLDGSIDSVRRIDDWHKFKFCVDRQRRYYFLNHNLDENQHRVDPSVTVLDHQGRVLTDFPLERVNTNPIVSENDGVLISRSAGGITASNDGYLYIFCSETYVVKNQTTPHLSDLVFTNEIQIYRRNDYG
jgi:hypothetical protein